MRKLVVVKRLRADVRRSARVLQICCRSLLLVFLQSIALGTTVNFEDLSIPASSYLNGDPGNLSAGQSVSNPIVSGSISFANTFGIDSFGGYDYPYWFGFAASNVVNTSDPAFTNQYASYPGGGYQSATYGVAYSDGATLALPAAGTVTGFRIANTTYAYLTMVNGDPYGFTAALAESDGYLLVTATGLLGGNTIGSAGFYLADLRTSSSPGVLAGWAWFDLSGLGTVDAVTFSFSGSDVGSYGLNTPAYFAMDDVVYAVPEPSTVMLLAGGALGWIAWRRRRARTA